MPAIAPLDVSRLRDLLADVPLWQRLEWVASTGSTNADLVRRARQGDDEGLVLISEEQTAGRGRFTRRWETPAGASLAFSMLLRPMQPAPQWGWLSLLAGMAVATGVEAATGAAPAGPAGPGRVQLKWPNDVLLDGGKLCGILSERVDPQPGGPAGGSASRPAAVVGIGINVSLAREELPVPGATSLLLAGLPTDKTVLMAAVLREFAQSYQQWEQHGAVHQAYSRRCDSIGAPLRVMVDEHTQVLGTGDHVDAQGRLVVRTETGLQAFSAGDVFHLRKQQDGPA